MMSNTHISIGVFSIITVLPTVKAGELTPISWGAMLVACVIGSMLPDIDHPGSAISRRLHHIPFIKHRGITHSLIGIFLMFNVATVLTIAGLMLGLGDGIGTALMLGYILHILADMLTPQGVLLLYPLPYRLGVNLITTGGNRETFLRLGMGVLSLIQIYNYFNNF